MIKGSPYSSTFLSVYKKGATRQKEKRKDSIFNYDKIIKQKALF